MRITELFTAQSIALDEALQTQEQILSRLVELQATHGNITDKEAYKKALYAREAEGSTYVDNGITVPHAKTNVVTRPSLAALRLSTPVQYNAEDDGTTDLLFAIAAPENGSLHVDMLARMMQMLMNEDFVEKLKAAKTQAGSAHQGGDQRLGRRKEHPDPRRDRRLRWYYRSSGEKGGHRPLRWQAGAVHPRR